MVSQTAASAPGNHTVNSTNYPVRDPTRGNWRNVVEQQTAVVEARSDPSVGGNEPILTTTILVNNIHCASCVSSIHGTLGALRPPPLAVTASVLTHEVKITHLPALATQRITASLDDVGFEVDTAITTDEMGNNLSETEPSSQQREGVMDQAAKRWARRLTRARPVPTTMNSPQERVNRKRHIENCKACRAQSDTLQDETQNSSRKRQSSTSPSSVMATSLPAEVERDSMPQYRQASRSLHRDSSGEMVIPMHDSESHNAAEMFDAVLSIGGMTCSSCSGSIAAAVKELRFVQSIDVNLINNSAFVSYYGPQNNITPIVTKIEDLGYECVAETASPAKSRDCEFSSSASEEPWNLDSKELTATISIEGMTCSSCVSTITKGLQELSSVRSVNINLLTHSGNITVSQRDRVEDIVRRVEELGYGCTIQELVESSQQRKPEGYNDMGNHRTVIIKVDGIYCEHCPPKILEALQMTYGHDITFESSPTRDTHTMKVTYRPMAPNFTIRDIIAT
ncbi:MAG: hypothetical protein M1833_002444, partial [Piccolia ochrophora]